MTEQPKSLMFLRTKQIFFLGIFITSLTALAFGQAKPGEGTAVQRLDVMGQKLTIMRRSLTSAAG